MPGLRLRVSSLAMVAVAVAACSHGGRSNASVPRRGGVLRVAVTTLGSLDPATAATPEQQTVASALFATLTTYDASRQSVVGGLAASWTASSNQRQFDFVLRGDAHFSDGSTVTPADVMATLDRIAAKGSASPVADLLAPVKGYAAVNRAGSTAHLAGVTSPGPLALRITLDQPFAELPAMLSNPDFGIVSRVSGPIGAFPGVPLTSGPFVLKSQAPGQLILSDATGSNAYVRELHFNTFSNASDAYAAFVRGAVDWSLVPPESFADAARRFGQGAFVPLAAELFYGFNVHNPAFVDRRVRQAVIEAIDRPAAAKAAYADAVLPSDGLIVSGVAGHQSDPCGTPCRFDPDGARALLRDVVASGQTLPSFSIDYDNDPTQDKVAHALQADLQTVGLTVTLRPHPLAAFQQAALAGQTQLFRLGWVAAYASADEFLSPLFTTGLATNLTRFSDPTVDALLAAARREADPTRRTADYQAAEQRILSALPVIPIAQFETHAVVASRVHGLTISPLGSFDPAKVWVG